jgi:hypothetical protein
MAAASQVLRALARRIRKASGWRRWPETSGSPASRSAAHKRRSNENLHRQPCGLELRQRRYRRWRVGGEWRRPSASAHPAAAAAAAAAPPQAQRHTATAWRRPRSLAEGSAGSLGTQARGSHKADLGRQRALDARGAIQRPEETATTCTRRGLEPTATRPLGLGRAATRLADALRLALVTASPQAQHMDRKSLYWTTPVCDACTEPLPSKEERMPFGVLGWPLAAALPELQLTSLLA